MSRILCLAISAMAAVLPGTVLALGLGEINLQSGLNQPFRAEIPVTSASAEEITGLKVSLASAETFERYGLLQAGFLTRFDFKVTGNAIRVTSLEPVVEPFVTMLIEVRWAQGRLLREYTVLLDPPVFESPLAAPAQPAPAAPARPAPRPVERPAPTAAPPAAPRARPPTSTAPPGSFGPVQRNDTLWNIASRTRPDASVTINQMMLAIYDANPEAFDGNINRLRAGAILRIPDATAAAGTSRGEAFAEVRRQNEAWRGAVPAPADTARLRLVPPGDAEAAAQAPGAAADGPAAGTIERVADLEAEVAERDRLLELKDQQLADLQAQLQAMREQQGEAAPVEAEPAPVEEAPFEETPIGEAPAEEPFTEEPGLAEPETAVDAEAPTEEAPAEPETPRRTIPPVVSRPAEEPGFVSQLITNPWLYGGLVLALLAGLFVARRRRGADTTGTWEELGAGETMDAESRAATDRLRAPVKEADETFVVEETPPQDTGPLEGPAAGTVAMDVAADRSGDQELPLEKTLSSDAALNLDQSDPLAEAEFHSAYGLYDQAADLLNAAIEAEPDRLELRQKLIEVYFSWDNRGGFQKAAEDYHERKQDGDQFWNKVLVMGKQLCPDEALFAGAPAAPATGDEMDLALTDEGAGDVDLALGGAEADVDLDLSGVPEEGLDFDLGDALMEGEDLSATERQEVGAEGPTMETPTIESPGPDAPTMETPTIELPGADAPTMESPTIEQAASTIESPTVDQPLNEPTMETPTIESPAIESLKDADRTSETASLDLDELGLDLSEFDDMEGEVAGDDDATLLAGEIDEATLLAGGMASIEPTSEVEQLEEELPSEDAVDSFLAGDSTAEQPGPDLDALTQAMEKSAAPEYVGDTVEQPRPEVEDTAEQPGPAAAGESIDFDVGEQVPESAPTGTLEKPARGREGPTMTEVGTKLDLARAYIDMGDPEGARSILGEVIDEGDEPQRQEAQRLLDTLSA